MSARQEPAYFGPVQHRDDPLLGVVAVARFRLQQRCYVCKTHKPATSFAPSRWLKRDYECRRCHRDRCARERLLETRGRRS